MLNVWKNIGSLSTKKKEPDKNDNGTITKFVADAMWSNFSAHKPAIIPILPNMKEDKKQNKIIIDPFKLYK